MNDLERVLPDPTPPPGTRERVRAGLPRRLERQQRRRDLGAYASVLAAASVAVAIAGLFHGRSERSVVVASRIEGAPLASGVLELPSRSRVLVEDGSAVSLVRDDDTGTTLRIDRGTLVANVAPRAPGQLFVVLARDVRVEVVGTLFAVAVHPDGAVGVRGVEGVVRVRRGERESKVGPGDTWPTPELAPEVDDSTRGRIAFTEPPVEVVHGHVAATEPRAGGEVAHATAEPRAGEQVAHATAEPRPSRDVSAHGPRSNPVPPSPYAEARRLEDAGKLAEAIEAYRAITSGPEAEDALYATARVLAASGDVDAADEAFRSYREHYADGRYARAADVHILDRAIARRDLDKVMSEANRFLAAHGTDPFAPRFLYARAAVRIRRGDCAGALADLGRVPRTAEVDQLRSACSHTR